MKNTFKLVLVIATALATSTTTSAHFKMLAPAPWLNTNDLGDPQKGRPMWRRSQARRE